MDLFFLVTIIISVFLVTIIIFSYKGWNIIYVMIIIIISMNILLWLHIDIKNNSYKLGQIDYHNGNMRYELIKQPNGELTWELKK